MSGRLAVVLCPERSGSTLFSVLLGAHSRVLAPPELHLLRYPNVGAWRAGYPQAQASVDWLAESLGIESGSMGPAMEPGEAYRAFLAATPDDHWVIDKTPAYAREAATLRRAESLKPVYLWLVRHPLGVAASRQEHRRRRRVAGIASAPNTARKLRAVAGGVRDRARSVARIDLRNRIAYWTDMHARIEAFLAAVPEDRQHKLVFEDLVTTPEPVLRGVCDTLGLEFEAPMLNPQAHLPPALAWGVGDQKIAQHKGIEASVADAWRDVYPEKLLDGPSRTLWERLRQS